MNATYVMIEMTKMYSARFLCKKKERNIFRMTIDFSSSYAHLLERCTAYCVPIATLFRCLSIRQTMKIVVFFIKIFQTQILSSFKCLKFELQQNKSLLRPKKNQIFLPSKLYALERFHCNCQFSHANQSKSYLPD